jgi:hypothetical protein
LNESFCQSISHSTTRMQNPIELLTWVISGWAGAVKKALDMHPLHTSPLSSATTVHAASSKNLWRVRTTHIKMWLRGDYQSARGSLLVTWSALFIKSVPATCSAHTHTHAYNIYPLDMAFCAAVTKKVREPPAALCWARRGRIFKTQQPAKSHWLAFAAFCQTSPNKSSIVQ